MSTVLIIEDNDKNMKLARDVLQNKGYKTLEAVTGEEGVKLAKQHVPDLVLMRGNRALTYFDIDLGQPGSAAN